MASKDLNLSFEHLSLWKEQSSRQPRNESVKPAQVVPLQPVAAPGSKEHEDARYKPETKLENQSDTPANRPNLPESAISKASFKISGPALPLKTLSIVTSILCFCSFVVATLWLTSQPTLAPQAIASSQAIVPETTASQATARQTVAAPVTQQPDLTNLEQQLTTLTAATNEQILLLEQRIEKMSGQLEVYASQQTDLYLNLTQQNKDVIKSLQAPTPATTSEPLNWFVNLATYAKVSAAQRLQNQLGELNFTTEISTTTLDNKTAYRVRIANLPDRETAEQTADAIMQKTSLNGLWVWKEG